MSDSQFGVFAALLMFAIGLATGIFLTLASFAGPQECSVEMEYAGSHRVQYLTECKL
jgi:hypothetical protein